jgi:hypothetical protein
MSAYQFEAEVVDDCRALVKSGWFAPVKFEVIGQRKAKGSGTDRGAPDAILSVGRWCHPCEFKRPASDGTRPGRFSHDQIEAARQRLAAGVYTYAPRTCQQFQRLIEWSKRHYDGRCDDCPVVVGGSDG